MTTQADIDSEIDLNFPSNTFGSITAANLRRVLHDMNASTFAQGIDTTKPYTWTGLQTFSGGIAPNAINGAFFGSNGDSSSIVLKDGGGNIRLDYGVTAASTWNATGPFRITAGSNGPTLALLNTVTSRFGNLTLANGFMALYTSGADDIILGTNNNVNANTIRMFASDGHVALNSGVASTSTTTGALVVTGGVGISGSLIACSNGTSTSSIGQVAASAAQMLLVSSILLNPTFSNANIALSGLIEPTYTAANNVSTVAVNAQNSIQGTFNVTQAQYGSQSILQSGMTAGIMQQAIGAQGYAYLTGASTIVQAVGVWGHVQNLLASGTITSAMALYAGTGFNLGTIGTWYGLYIDTPPPATNKFGIFVSADVKSQFNGLIQAAASVTARASINVPVGVAPTSPNDGDLWYESGALKFRLSGTTKTVTLT